MHKRGKCSQKCSGCNKYGSHKEADCWELFPHKKPKDYETPKKNRDRGRERDRTRSKSRESEDTRVKKKGRDQSPHTSKTLGRVLTEKPADTYRESSDDQDDLKKAERILQKSQEQVEKEN